MVCSVPVLLMRIAQGYEHTIMYRAQVIICSRNDDLAMTVKHTRFICFRVPETNKAFAFAIGGIVKYIQAVPGYLFAGSR
ncbi:hypothetical protein D3C80_1655820 [compost metagenome]